MQKLTILCDQCRRPIYQKGESARKFIRLTQHGITKNQRISEQLNTFEIGEAVELCGTDCLIEWAQKERVK